VSLRRLLDIFLLKRVLDAFLPSFWHLESNMLGSVSYD
jgi:hypothetical protein